MRCVFVFVLGLFGWGLASPYRVMSVAEARTAPPGTLVRVWGRYQTETAGQAWIGGQLVSGNQTLSVKGQVFDWRPKPDQLVELWGRLEPGPLLQFHNGRAPGEARRPRPTSPLHEGKTVSVWLEVQDAGPTRFSFAQGVTEDRRVFFLPKYEGPRGMVCLHGEVGFLSGPGGRRALLRGATRCAVR